MRGPAEGFCGDGLDNNCDGHLDDGCITCDPDCECAAAPAPAGRR
jgi:hypothetical protein